MNQELVRGRPLSMIRVVQLTQSARRAQVVFIFNELGNGEKQQVEVATRMQTFLFK